ncbi:DUF6268 family outer membrane beta-barrel protein [Ulvibacterium sp.]|uniref:DUF6268 family outer membrane beta-barrel protein n=1 Tax=Ulvibacterium sp. TaxID=2665914 RepID=UPI00263230B6|nr:DUF6268 family outer membrane beta-barrel protein [Ulvibacterium sp.]
MKGIFYLVAGLLVASAYGQIPIIQNPGEVELAGIDYGYLPDLGGTEIHNYNINLNLAKPVGKSIIGLGLTYRYFDFTFDESTNILDLSTYENMHVIRTNLLFVRPLRKDWTLLVSAGPTLMSNFANGVSSEDIVVNALGAVNKRWGDFERNTVLMLGVLYGTQFGEPRVLPALLLRQKLNRHWSYSFGLPITGINYRINDRHRISALVSPEGLFGNNSNAIAVDGNRILTDTKIQFNGINARLLYRYRFTKNLAFVAEGGFLPAATLRIVDNDNNEIFDLEPGSGTYFKFGIRFALKRPSQNKNLKSDDNEN